jgi:hypothetical protein
MLSAIHTAVQTLLRDRGLIDALDVDVSFEVPQDEWVRSLTRPTVDLFLFEVQENTEKRDSSPQTTVNGGRAERRMPPRRIDLYYMVSVLTADVEDEHELLWRVLATLMKYQQFPPEVLPDALRSIAPPMTARIASRDDARNLLDLWSALDTEPHPAICYVLTAPMDLALTIEAPLVLTRTARYRKMASGDQVSRDVGVQIGGTVRDSIGHPVADVTISPAGTGQGSVTASDGRYILQGIPEGAVMLTVARNGQEQKRVQVRVPGDSYDIVLDG